MRTLIVMRHAKSAWDSGALSDHDRPLTRRGERDAPRMGAWLASQDIGPMHLLASTALRARRTAQLVAAELGVRCLSERTERGLYLADREALLARLAQPLPAEALLLVGHNPGLEELCAHLLGVPAGEVPKLPTGACRVLALPEDWTRLAPGTARLIAAAAPRELADGEDD